MADLSPEPDFGPDKGQQSDNVETRFGVATLATDMPSATTTMSMPVADLLNPLTGRHSIGPLAIVVDDVGGMVNSYRRLPHEWPVTSELVIELTPQSAAILHSDLTEPVSVSGCPQGPKGSSALALCTISHGAEVIGCATVRSFYVPLPAMPDGHVDSLTTTPTTSLAELLAVQTRPALDGVHRLTQSPDPILVNAVGSLHGGVATAGMEMVASAAVNAGHGATPLHTSSIHVNFLRPFIAGGRSHYAGTAVRIGRQTAVADAQAIDGDGKVCAIARVTAYA